MNPRLSLPILAALALSWAPVDAQCNQPDGLDGAPCCAPTTLNLPAFPDLQMQAQGDCWDSCSLVSQNCLRLLVAPPSPGAQCSQFKAPLEVYECTPGNPIMKGDLTLDYTRTWNEFPVAGNPPIQVWRFAAKVDLFQSTATPPCPVPPCAITPQGAFYYGYVDYSLNCTTGAWTGVVVLFHNCDDFIHNQGWSSNPGTWHPTSTFGIVGPDTGANPFVPSATPPTAGVITAEAVRKVTPVFSPTVCMAEEPVFSGLYIPIGVGCICPLSFGPVRNSVVRLEGDGACGSKFQSLNFWPYLPWFEMVTTTMGRWTTSASYPGPEEAHVAEGLFLFRDGCIASGPVNNFDVFYGGITEGGFFASPITTVSGPLTNRFVDLASNYSKALPGAVTLPFVGSVGPTDHLIYVNF